MIAYSVHSFRAVSSLFTVCVFNSSMSRAVGEHSQISEIEATALATTWEKPIVTHYTIGYHPGKTHFYTLHHWLPPGKNPL